MNTKSSELKALTGFNFAFMYFSTCPQDILIDFENKDHKKLLQLVASKEEFTKSETDKIRRLMKKIGVKEAVVSKYQPDLWIRMCQEDTVTFENLSNIAWGDQHLKLIASLF